MHYGHELPSPWQILEYHLVHAIAKVSLCIYVSHWIPWNLTLVDDKSEIQEFNIDVIGEILNSTKKKKKNLFRSLDFIVFILTMPIKKCLTT
jgi:hypothetical protein